MINIGNRKIQMNLIVVLKGIDLFLCLFSINLYEKKEINIEKKIIKIFEKKVSSKNEFLRIEKKR